MQRHQPDLQPEADDDKRDDDRNMRRLRKRVHHRGDGQPLPRGGDGEQHEGGKDQPFADKRRRQRDAASGAIIRAAGEGDQAIGRKARQRIERIEAHHVARHVDAKAAGQREQPPQRKPRLFGTAVEPAASREAADDP